METPTTRDSSATSRNSRQLEQRRQRRVPIQPPGSEAPTARRTARPRPPKRETPWGEVGPGWSLALVSPSVSSSNGSAPATHTRHRARRRATLYLVDPSGSNSTQLSTLRAVEGQHLAAWSGDLRRALLCHPGEGGTVVRELALDDGGVLHQFSMARGATVSYTRPRGLSVLVNDRGRVTWIDLDHPGAPAHPSPFVRGARTAGASFDFEPAGESGQRLEPPAPNGHGVSSTVARRAREGRPLTAGPFMVHTAALVDGCARAGVPSPLEALEEGGTVSSVPFPSDVD